MVDPQTCEAVSVARLGGVGKNLVEPKVFKLGTVSLLCARTGGPRWCLEPDSSAGGHNNITLWNAMIRGYAYNGPLQKCVSLYNELLQRRLKPNNFTYPYVLKSCLELVWCKIEKKVQCQIIKTGFQSASFAVESLFNLKMVVLGVDRINYVRKIFNDMFIRPVELWNQMISGKCKGFVERMPEKNIMSWNSMIGLSAGCGDIGLSSKLERYGCITDLLCRNGLLEEAEDLVKGVPFKAE
ncbi:hypothetical protein LguiB_008164 [Lonicera macranthoides]